jgi:hypothetical protein
VAKPVSARPAVPAPAPPVRPTAAVPRPAAAAPSVPTGRLAGRIDQEPRLVRKFRLLRLHVDEARGLNARQLRDLLELFPPGWGRRRALDTLLEHRIPDSLNKAIFLIEQLDSNIERRWCVSTLLHEWQLTDEEKQLLAERHGMFRGGIAAES